MFRNAAVSQVEATDTRPAGRWLLGVATALAALPALVAFADQVTGRRLEAHANAIYEGHGVDVEPEILYVLVYLAAGLLVVLWGAAAVVARFGRRRAAVTAAAMTVVTVAIALTMVLVTEYGERVLPPVWGVLAALPAVAGAVATVRLARRRSAGA